MAERVVTVAALLMDIEKELREMRLWETEVPSEEALSSTAPFAVDTLTFPQWIQFIFLPRLYFMLEQNIPLPQVSGIAPMAEEYFAPLGLPSNRLVTHFKQFDALVSAQ